MNQIGSKSWAHQLFSSVLILCVCFSIAEVVLRRLAPIRLAGIQSTYQFDRELGLRLRPGVRAWESSDYLKEVWVNSLGTVNFQESFESYPIRIFALGDSYTQGTGLLADAAYPFQLDLALNEDESGLYVPRYAIVNFGLAAFGGEQSILALRRYAESLGSPRACLYLGAENDYSDDLLFRAGYRHEQVVEGSPKWGRLVKPILWASRLELFKRLKIAVSLLRRKQIFAGAGADDAVAAEPNSPSAAEQSWEVIERIRATCLDYGAPLIVSWAAPGRSYSWLKARAGEQDIQFADWWPRVESVIKAVPGTSCPIQDEPEGRGDSNTR